MIKDLPEKLRLLRSENKYTQKQLAELFLDMKQESELPVWRI